VPRSDFEKKPGDKWGKPKNASYDPVDPWVPKRLARRLKGTWDETSWEKIGSRVYDPPTGTRMHRPGSQKR